MKIELITDDEEITESVKIAPVGGLHFFEDLSLEEVKMEVIETQIIEKVEIKKFLSIEVIVDKRIEADKYYYITSPKSFIKREINDEFEFLKKRDYSKIKNYTFHNIKFVEKVDKKVLSQTFQSIMNEEKKFNFSYLLDVLECFIYFGCVPPRFKIRYETEIDLLQISCLLSLLYGDTVKITRTYFHENYTDGSPYFEVFEMLNSKHDDFNEKNTIKFGLWIEMSPHLVDPDPEFCLTCRTMLGIVEKNYEEMSKHDWEHLLGSTYDSEIKTYVKIFVKYINDSNRN